VTDPQESKKKSKTILPDKFVTYLDFSIRLRRAYETIQKIQNNRNEKHRNIAQKDGG
jgi:hypothetical protein